MRNDLRSQGLEVPDAVARPAASPDLALAALREVENQPHAGRQHKVEEPEISDDDEDVEEEGDIGGRYAEEIMEVGDDPCNTLCCADGCCSTYTHTYIHTFVHSTYIPLYYSAADVTWGPILPIYILVHRHVQNMYMYVYHNV